MKKLILISGLIMSLVTIVSAQDQNKPILKGAKNHQNMPVEERAKNNTIKAEKELALTADQKIKWEAASLERMKQNEPLKQKMQGSTTPDERKSLRQQMRANNQKFVQTVLTFLTPDQKTKFEAMKKAKPGKGKGHGHREQKGDVAPAPSEINKN